VCADGAQRFETTLKDFLHFHKVKSSPNDSNGN